jgi:exosortase H (IPTLxxWG-CTERM-specific)
LGKVAQRTRKAGAERGKELRFCLVFALLTVAIFAALYAAHDLLVVPLNRHIAWITGATLGALGLSAVTVGPVISARGFAVEIKNNCNAIFELGLYAAAVCAYPASLGAKTAGVLVGAAVLYAVNFVRVLSLIALGIFARDWFEIAHFYAWQVVFFATVVACWFGWILRTPRRA